MTILVLGMAGAAAAWLLDRPLVSAGLALGTLVAALNYRIGATAVEQAAGKSAAAQAGLLGRYLLRLLLSATTLFVGGVVVQEFEFVLALLAGLVLEMFTSLGGVLAAPFRGKG